MWFSCLKLDCRSHKQLGVISRGSGVSDSHEVNLGIVGETSVDAPLLLTLFYIITVMLSQLNKDIDYCTRILGCNAEQTDELIGAAEKLTVNAEYFCEEFIVAPDGENAMKYQRPDFIDLDAFNAFHGIYFEEVD